MAETVAILPAPGGSKRLSHKNIRPFHGRAAIGWPIAAARAAVIGRIVGRTDDPEIVGVSRAEGAEGQYPRDATLADDHTGTTDAIRDAVARLGLARRDAGTDWVLPIGRYPTPIDRACKPVGDRLVPRDPAMMPRRSQDPEPAFSGAGQVHGARAARWLDPAARVWDGAAGVEPPPQRAVDIDTENDTARAEALAAAARG